MFRIIVVIAFLFSGCLDDPPYNVKPVVEFCSDDLCYSEAVPLLQPDDEESKVWYEYFDSLNWPEEGLDVDDHEHWCNSFGWRTPVAGEMYAIFMGCLTDVYSTDCDFLEYEGGPSEYRSEVYLELPTVVEHYKLSSRVRGMTEGEYFGFASFKQMKYSFYARCVKPNE